MPFFKFLLRLRTARFSFFSTRRAHRLSDPHATKAARKDVIRFFNNSRWSFLCLFKILRKLRIFCVHFATHASSEQLESFFLYALIPSFRFLFL